MNKEIQQALKNDQLIGITTIDRKTGNPHRIEIGLVYADGQLYLPLVKVQFGSGGS